MSAAAPFFILTLPRSRSKWLSAFLSPPDATPCGHDLAVECSSVSDFQAAVAARPGTVETGAVLGASRLLAAYPLSTFISIHRPVAAVTSSLSRLGIPYDLSELLRRASLLEEFAQSAAVLSYDYEELNERSICEEIYELCLGLPLPAGWWESLRDKNIQIDLLSRISRLRERREAIEEFKQEVLSL